MPLASGARLGPYDIVAPLGAGGMGEVYRARDAKLNRDVAIKVLLPAVANDPDRLARFSREAQVLASLNHPGIAHIYGLDRQDDIAFIVMELVEGEELAQRIARGPIPWDEALPIAKQIADALEAAHEQGIIHRDLKPANIKVRADGTVKVLDFGLAKAIEGPGGSGGPGGLSMSPTISMHATQAGIILGTAAYMSPEQARGKTVDRRADIWAFGGVLYEMLTGTRAFPGDDVTDTIVAVVSKEPDWSALPAAAASVRPLLVRCLKKDPKARMRDIGEARLQIDELLSGASGSGVIASAPASEASPSRRVMPVWLGAALAGGALITAALVTWFVMRPVPPAPVHPMRFAIVPPASQQLGQTAVDRLLALSPDGTHLVYVAGSLRGGGGQLMVRAIDQLDAVPLGGVTNARAPFISPDGKWIGYFDGTELKKVSVTGGPSITLCHVTGTPRGASWGPDDTIVFATAQPSTGLLSVPAGGGSPKVLTKADEAHGESDHFYPSVLPAGGGVLFTIWPSTGSIDNAQVAVLDRKTGERRILIRGGSHADYVEPSTGSGQVGHLVYAVAGALRAVRFDPVKLEVLSDPVPVLDQVMTVGSGAAEFAVSRTGALVYVPGSASATGQQTGQLRTLVWVDRRGKEEAIPAPPRTYVSLRLSPDGTKIALDARDQQQDIWIFELARRTLTRLTIDPAIDGYPVWTPDGRRIIFESNRGSTPFNLYSQAADGTGAVEQLTKGPNPMWPFSISPDGTRVVLHVGKPGGGDLDLLILDGKSPHEPLIHTPAFNTDHGEISPDGRWLAYESNESGQQQVYVRPFPNVNGGHWQVSPAGGIKPVWSRNGRELFYLSGRALMTVPIQTTTTFSVGNPTKLFEGPYYAQSTARTYDVTRDGQKFLMIKEPQASPDEKTPQASMVVVLNWVEELRSKLPTTK